MSDNQQVASNRKAFHDFEILQRVEAGISLTGTEIKSIRANGASIREAYARPLNGEMWLYGAHIAPYDAGCRFRHLVRDRDGKCPRQDDARCALPRTIGRHDVIDALEQCAW